MQPKSAEVTGVPKPGEVLAGKYRVESVLGMGGMGVVLAAWHLVLERRVAIKFLLPAAAALPDAGPRFIREARAAASLVGEHIARVLDVGSTEDGAAYMVLEYLTGSDLDHLLRSRGPLPIAEAVDYLLQACEGIAEAHARGIIHRDLKPKNLFITRRPDGTPLIKVLDFGLSKMLLPGDVPREASLTETGLIMGSVHYMSPEQVRSLKSADARTDIWALGVILYRMLSGGYPFEGESIQAVTASIMVDSPPPLATSRPEVPSAIDELLARCLAKNPAQRVQSVTEIARVLAPFGTPRAMAAFESIARVLPESAAVPPALRASSPSWTRPEVPSAPPAHSSAPTQRDAEAMSSPPQATLPHASWGNTTRSHAPRARLVMVLGAAGMVLAGATAGVWLGAGRTPAEAGDSSATPRSAAPSTTGVLAQAERAPVTATAAPVVMSPIGPAGAAPDGRANAALGSPGAASNAVEPTSAPTAGATAKPTTGATAKPTAGATTKPTTGATTKPIAGATAKPIASPPRAQSTPSKTPGPMERWD